MILFQEKTRRRTREAKERRRAVVKNQASAGIRAKKAEEAARKRAEEEKKRQAIQEKLKQISPCPAGFAWHKVGGGWRCAGGSHFVSDRKLNDHFTY